MNLEKAVAKRTSEFLIKENISQYELAKRANLTKQTISNIINEKYKSLKLETLYKIADAFNMELSEFTDCEYLKRKNLDVD